MRSFIAGVISGTLLVFVSFSLNFVANGIFLPDLASQKLFSVVPGTVESFFVTRMGELAKLTAFGASTVLTIIFYGFVGHVYSRFNERLNLRLSDSDKNKHRNRKRRQREFSSRFNSQSSSNNILRIILLSLSPWFFLGIVVFPLVGVGFFGLNSKLGPGPFNLLVLTPHFLFSGMLLSLTKPTPDLKKAEEILVETRIKKDGLSRRIFIRRGAVAIVGLAILAFGVSILLRSQNEKPEPGSPQPAAQTPPGTVTPAVTYPASLPKAFKHPELIALVASEITSNDKFYVVSKNIFDPTVDLKNWLLIIDGEVDHPTKLSYNDILKMPSRTQYTTLECISNEVGGDLISTAKWTGVQLKQVLDLARLKPEAKFLTFTSYDDYTVTVPLERALRDEAILAHKINDAPLPSKHGFPVRAIIPGLFGMMNAKWITRIEARKDEFLGYWQRRGWSATGIIETTSIIRYPTSGAKTHGEIPVAGIAFSGDREISRVEVSTDGGKTWNDAMLKDPLSGLTWVLWAYEWLANEAGILRIKVRATDKQGNVQIAEFVEPFPNGAAGYHEINVQITK